jgi:hypothetical protein
MTLGQPYRCLPASRYDKATYCPQSARIDNQKAVPVDVAEEKLRRYGIFLGAMNLSVVNGLHGSIGFHCFKTAIVIFLAMKSNATFTSQRSGVVPSRDPSRSIAGYRHQAKPFDGIADGKIVGWCI